VGHHYVDVSVTTLTLASPVVAIIGVAHLFRSLSAGQVVGAAAVLALGILVHGQRAPRQAAEAASAATFSTASALDDLDDLDALDGT
jgi:hypothetical protein